jgi:plasmid stabilization system protein ParE
LERGSVTLKISRRASRQIEEATEWWAEHRLSAPGALTEELNAAIARIQAEPNIVGSSVKRTRLGQIRRHYIRRIHYHLYFRIDGADVEIVAFWHASRGTPPAF